MAFLKVILLLAGDIESNPGSSDHKKKNQKSVLVSFHQGHTKFGATAGIQCACTALHSICLKITIFYLILTVVMETDALLQKVTQFY